MVAGYFYRAGVFLAYGDYVGGGYASYVLADGGG